MANPDSQGDKKLEKSSSFRQVVASSVGKILQKILKRRIRSESKLGEVEMNSDSESLDVPDSMPLALENELAHNERMLTYNNGPYMVMEGMLWQGTPVTVKRLHRRPMPDMQMLRVLQNECVNSGRFRHPNIVLLMSICVTEGPERFVLLYEQIELGSLYQFIHIHNFRLTWRHLEGIVMQICSALQYIHSHCWVHCSISSHALQLCTTRVCKLSNLEFMQSSNLKKRETEEQLSMKFLYNWMAPEMVLDRKASIQSDIYSICSVIWEAVYAKIPWTGMKPEEIVDLCLDSQLRLPLDEWISYPFNNILKAGLVQNPEVRTSNIAEILQILSIHSVSKRSSENSLSTMPPTPIRNSFKAESTPVKTTEIKAAPAANTDEQRGNYEGNDVGKGEEEENNETNCEDALEKIPDQLIYVGRPDFGGDWRGFAIPNNSLEPNNSGNHTPKNQCDEIGDQKKPSEMDKESKFKPENMTRESGDLSESLPIQNLDAQKALSKFFFQEFQGTDGQRSPLQTLSLTY